MRRFPVLLVAIFLVLPSAALAQSAGDEQYADPFGQVEEPSPSQGEPEPQPAPAPEPAPAPAPTEPPVAGQDVVAAQETDAPTLPATGAPAHLLAGAGGLLFAAGAALRRRLLP
jgi:hypothetical protein